MRKTKQKKKQSKRRSNDPRKRVAQDFREFKAKLKRMIDKTKLIWEGQPYADGSIYRFVLASELTNFVIGVSMRALEADEERARSATLQVAEAVRLATKYDNEDGGLAEPTEETDASYEKFLTDSAPEGNTDLDARAEEKEAPEVEDPTDGPERPQESAE